ncbi:hypothetical protein HZA96_02390 [Candidatus Woesearchaeota archaeon]|nr:hypothetical protein [Candidatus Woesearchaeota archaeon]
MEDINQEEQFNNENQEQCIHDENKSKSNDDVYLEWKKYIELRKKVKEDNQENFAKVQNSPSQAIRAGEILQKINK